MDELTQLIKKNIKFKYQSTRRFAETLGIPQTTIVSAIKNGVSGTSFTTVCKICKALDIKLMNGVYPVVVSDATKNLVEKISKLDEKGIHAVTSMLELEYLRCEAENNAVAAAEMQEKLQMARHSPFLSPEQVPTKVEVAELSKALDES